jgi:hypothetical protein
VSGDTPTSGCYVERLDQNTFDIRRTGTSTARVDYTRTSPWPSTMFDFVFLDLLVAHMIIAIAILVDLAQSKSKDDDNEKWKQVTYPVRINQRPIERFIKISRSDSTRPIN